MAHSIMEIHGIAEKSGIILKIKLQGVPDVFLFRTKNFKSYYRFGAHDLCFCLISFLIYNFCLSLSTEIFSVQYFFGFFSFLISILAGVWAVWRLSFSRDFKEWHGAEHKLVNLLKNCKNMDILNFQNSPRVSLGCGSRSSVCDKFLFIYCAMIIGLDKATQYFLGDAHSWIIFVALFFLLLSQYKKLCDKWLWRLLQKYLLIAEPDEEKIKETLELGWRIKRFIEGEDFDD